MGAEKIDEIFKSALSDKESEVGNDSWSKLEMMLDNRPIKKGGLWVTWSTAAVVSVLLIVGWLHWNGMTEEEHTQLVSHNYTTPDMTLEAKPVPDLSEEQSVVPMVLTGVSVKTNRKSFPAATQAHDDIVETIEDEPQIDEIAQVQVIEEQKGETSMPIKITYKKGRLQNKDVTLAVSPIDSTSKHRVKELLSQAKEFDPGNVWADIRDAKERVMEDPFGLHKEQRQKLK
ncbi:hypothetical protein N6H18_12205 [Reichenbachiella agarivorans]|uniref:Uncharacterized protein n=1 Tax=Reichenbachiella agarivorans TaxID=2979464 RepID=A0ABY6CKS2_9BACT|nr:hypothetical protein [Reichenbachiella agarivorans]UXP31113.1 hypothetical protein N6H18_12205 [Reichenbachiella agarivorans]